MANELIDGAKLERSAFIIQRVARKKIRRLHVAVSSSNRAKMSFALNCAISGWREREREKKGGRMKERSKARFFVRNEKKKERVKNNLIVRRG